MLSWRKLENYSFKFGWLYFNPFLFVLFALTLALYTYFDRGSLVSLPAVIGISFAISVFGSAVNRIRRAAQSTSKVLVIESVDFWAHCLVNGIWLYTMLVLLAIFPIEVSTSYWSICFFTAITFLAFGARMHIRQIVIGHHSVIYRRGFVFFWRETEYELTEIKSIKATPYWTLQIRLKSEKGFSLFGPMIVSSHMLPPRRLGWLGSRLNEYLKRRLTEANVQTVANDDFTVIPFRVFGFKHFLVATAVMLPLVTYSLASERSRVLASIADTPADKLRYKHFHAAFLFYKGKAYDNLADEYLAKCKANHDHNCRLASYFSDPGRNDIDAPALLRMSCNEADPLSCYNLLVIKSVTDEDRAKAQALLDRVCREGKAGDKETCAAYEQLNKGSP